MAYRTYSYGGGFGALGGGMTPWVRRLLIANTALYLLVVFSRFVPGLGEALGYLALRPAYVLFTPWSLLTYAFLHASILHLLGNMLVLFFFGPRLEDHWGSRDFIRYYLVAAFAGGLASVLLFALAPAGAIVGASGATLGLLLAFALNWPDQEVHIWGIFPIKVKWLVTVIAAMNLVMAVEGSGGGVAVLAHLGGMVGGYLWLRSPWGPKGWGNLPSKPRGSGTSRSPGTALASWMGRKRESASRPAPVASARPPVAATRSRKVERELLEDVDRILDKISQHGIASLTAEERKRLDEVSRQRRTN